MHVVFVLPDAYGLAILESGKISLNRELNVSAAENGMLLTIAMAIFTSAEVTFERKKHAFSWLTHTRYIYVICRLGGPYSEKL